MEGARKRARVMVFEIAKRNVGGTGKAIRTWAIAGYYGDVRDVSSIILIAEITVASTRPLPVRLVHFTSHHEIFTFFNHPMTKRAFQFRPLIGVPCTSNESDFARDRTHPAPRLCLSLVQVERYMVHRTVSPSNCAIPFFLPQPVFRQRIPHVCNRYCSLPFVNR